MKHVHTVSLPNASAQAMQDRLVVALKTDVANAAGGSNGAAVTTHITFGAGQLPAKYSVQVTPNQACMASVTNKTDAGFDVVLTPLATVTLGAGTFDVAVLA